MKELDHITRDWICMIMVEIVTWEITLGKSQGCGLLTGKKKKSGASKLYAIDTKCE